MKRVIIHVEKLNRDFPFDFDNLSARDDVMTKLYSQNPQLKKQVELGQLDEMSDFYLTWVELDEMGQPVVNTVPSEMITPEMREAGVDESTPIMTREELVEQVGEDEVAKIEAEPVKPAKASKPAK